MTICDLTPRHFTGLVQAHTPAMPMPASNVCLSFLTSDDAPMCAVELESFAQEMTDWVGDIGNQMIDLRGAPPDIDYDEVQCPPSDM